MYQRNVHAHLETLLALDLGHHGPWEGQAAFNMDRYSGLRQTALEYGPVGQSYRNDPSNEEWERIWVEINQIVEGFLRQVQMTLEIADFIYAEGESPEDYFEFMKDCAEDHLLFQILYCPSNLEPVTPWMPITDSIRRGLLLTMKQDKEDSYPSIYARGNKKERSVYPLDYRLDLQQMVHRFLYHEAKGFKNAKTLAAIADFLKTTWGEQLRPQDIQQKALVPLKRAGVIGSMHQRGYFLLTTAEDCEQSIRFYKSKRDAMDTIIKATETVKQRFEAEEQPKDKAWNNAI